VNGKYILVQKEAVRHYFDITCRSKLAVTECNHEKSSARLCWHCNLKRVLR